MQKKTWYVIGALVCVCAITIALVCTQCGTPADTTTTTAPVTTTTGSVTTSFTTDTTVTADGTDTTGGTTTQVTTISSTTAKTTKKTTAAALVDTIDRADSVQFTTAKATKPTTAASAGSTITLHAKTTYYGVEGYFCTWECDDNNNELLTKLGILPDKAGATVYNHYTEYYDMDNGKEVWFVCYADKQVGDGKFENFQVKVHTKKPPTTTTTTTTSAQSKYHEYPNGFPDVDVEISIYEEYMLELINEGRAKEGLKPLKMNTYYHDLAEIRAEEASIVWSHTRPNGTKWWTVYEDANRGALGYSVGENLATDFEQQYGFTMIKSVYEALYSSEGHRANMMNPVYTEVALAIHWEEATSNFGDTSICGTMAQLFIGPQAE